MTKHKKKIKGIHISSIIPTLAMNIVNVLVYVLPDAYLCFGFTKLVLYCM